MTTGSEAITTIFDADNHYWETSDAFTRHRDPKFADRGVQVKEVDGLSRYVIDGEVFQWLPGPADVHPRPAPGSFMDYFVGKLSREDFDASFNVAPSTHPEWYDRQERLKVMDEQGVEAIWMFPSQGVVLEAPMLDTDVEATIEIMRAFNRWIEEDWGFAYKDRIFGVPFLNLSDPDKATDELQWCLDHGARVVAIRHGAAVTPYGLRSPADPMFDRFWGLAQESGIVVSSHDGSDHTYADMYTLLGQVWGDEANVVMNGSGDNMKMMAGGSVVGALMKHRIVHDFAYFLVAHRLFERFPRLKVAFIENGSAWVSPLLHALETLGHGGDYQAKPKDMFIEHCWVAPFVEENVDELARHLPVERILFGSDWPHGEGYSQPKDFFENVANFSIEDQRRIMYQNARRAHSRVGTPPSTGKNRRASSGTQSFRGGTVDEVIVHTRQGALRGQRQPAGCVFRGVRFARPPVGRRRFMPPEPPETWTGVRDATSFGPVAMQIPTVLETERALPSNMSEDCLSLNIWAPDLPENPAEALPVMVWLHGGAFVNGSGSIPWYDGSALAARGDVVVVTINYRLGVFGYLSLVEFGDQYDRSGNLGLLDQFAALSWIRENVAAFGGDPNRVCVVGESAGAMSIGTLLSTGAAEGLFHRAILQSGTPVAQAAETAAHTTKDLFAALDIDRDESGLARLNALAAEDILNAAAQMAIRKMTAGDSDAEAFPWSPVIDGVVVEGDPTELGTNPRVPVLIGTTRDEMRIMRVLFPERPPLDLPQLEDQVGALCGPLRDDILRAYAARNPSGTPDDLWDAIVSDRVFGLPTVDFIDQRVKNRAPTWTYLFNWTSAAHGGIYGSAHTVEIPFVFNTFDAPGVADFLGRPRSATDGLTARVQQAWVNFARDGFPSADGLPEWPPCGSGTRPTMVFDVECMLNEDPDARIRALWKHVDK